MTTVQRSVAAFCLSALSATAAAQAPLGTSFTYQGRLESAGLPASSSYDLRFQLFDVAVGGAAIATDCADGVVPQSGLFTVELDFGGAAFDGNARWMEVAVRTDATPGNCASGVYTTLSPRQPLTAAPYALYALSGPGSGGQWTAIGNNITNTNSGFVGIHRSTPLTSAEFFGLQAAVTTGYGGMYIRTDGPAALPFYGYRAGPVGETAWTYLDGASGDWRVHVDGDRLTVTDTGFVGIGTTTPGFRLQVLENTPANEAMYVRNTGAGRAATFESLTAGGSSAVLCSKQGGTALTVLSTLSSGLPATDAPLAVAGGSDASAAGGGFVVCGPPSGVNISIDNNELMCRNNGQPATLALNAEGGNVNLIQAGAGAVVIGTTVAPAGVKLAVDGKILCEELEVQLSQDWPDYVFADDYLLAPLSEVDAFVRQHRHLPGVPSAAQVKVEGVNVGQMQTTLLRKVEEITLHLIALDQQIQQLRTENAELREQLASRGGLIGASAAR